MPGGGDFVWFFRPGGRSFALKSCPRGGDFDGKKLEAWGSARGGMVTGQIDTCITTSQHKRRNEYSLGMNAKKAENFSTCLSDLWNQILYSIYGVS